LEDFLKNNYLTLTKSIEILAVVTGLLLFKKYKGTTAKYFIYFLCYIILCETIGSYAYYVWENRFLSFLKGTIFERNYWWQTLYWKIGAILFFSFYYRKVLKNKIFNLSIKYISLVFLIISVFVIITNWNDFFLRSFPTISIVGAMVVLLCSIFYFIETLRSQNILDFYSSINFYISLAIFIWWLIITPLVFYDIYNSKRDWNFVILKWQIYLFANIFMYTTFTIGLIVSKPEALK